MIENPETPRPQKQGEPTIAEMINAGTSTVSKLVASYTKAILKTEKELKTPMDRATADQISDKPA